jgi:hypothetical protein
VNDARRGGKTISDLPATTYVADRQKALGRFRTLPWAEGLEPQRKQMGQAIQRLWAQWDGSDEEFQRAYDDARASAFAFMATTGAKLIKPPNLRAQGRRRAARQDQ